MSLLVIRGGTLITMDSERRVLEGDLLIASGRIAAVGDVSPPPGAATLDAGGCLVLPGLVQAHTHLCQTLLRGAAEGLPLLDWLRQRVWPHEAALDERALRAAARLAVAELLLGGTTTVLDMASVHETDALFDAVAATGLRATIGKAMMDTGDGVPARLRESTRRSLDESDALARRWQGAAEGRLGYAYAPRFVLSCTEQLLAEVGARVAAGARVHTHASEQQTEVEAVRRERGADNVVYLERLGLCGARATLAHCVKVSAAEQQRLAATNTRVVHCPASNLKLASGIAPVPEMLAQGISVALGSDGAACNNNLDAFVDMRLAALLHQPRLGPRALPAAAVLELATLGGARALGLEREIGSLEPNRRADVIVVDARAPHATPAPDPLAALVYAVQSCDVRDVLVDGRLLVRNRRLTEATGLDLAEVMATANAESARIASLVR